MINLLVLDAETTTIIALAHIRPSPAVIPFLHDLHPIAGE